MQLEPSSGSRSGRVPYPKMLSLFPSLKCNYRCFFCPRGDNASYPSSDFEQLATLAPAIAAAEIVDITGWGEPLLYPRIRDLIHLIERHNGRPCISITTNGFLLTEDLAALLARNLHHIVVSLNAATRQTYERDMVNGKWDRVLENLGAARKHIPGEKMIFSFVAHRRNIHEFPEFVRLAHQFGVQHVSLTHLIVTKPEIIQESLWYDKERANQYMDAAMLEGRRLGVEVAARRFGGAFLALPQRTGCDSPFRETIINVDGTAGPCCYAGRHYMGNVYESGFDAVWYGAEYEKLRKERHFPECRSCFKHASVDDLDTLMAKDLFDNPARYDFTPGFQAIVPVDASTTADALAATIDSLRWQTYPAWRCILATTEDEIPDTLRAPLAALRRPAIEVRGATLLDACTAAFREPGDYACVVRPGTCWHPEKLERLLTAFRSDAAAEADAIAHAALDLGPDPAPPLRSCAALRAARKRPELFAATMLGLPVNGADPAIAGRALPDRLDLRVPGAPTNDRRAYVNRAARDLNAAGEAAFQAGDVDVAREAFRAAIALEPHMVGPHNNLAVVEWHAGRREAALLAVRRAFLLDPNNPEVRKNAKEMISSVESSASTGSGPIAPGHSEKLVTTRQSERHTGHGPLLAVLDFSAQPYSIGDVLTFVVGSTVAAREVGADRVEYCLVSDPDVVHCDPVMAANVTSENHRDRVLMLLPLLGLSPLLGTIHVFNRRTEFLAFLDEAGPSFRGMWPSREDLEAKRYLYYDVFAALHRSGPAVRDVPMFRVDAGRVRRARAFLEREAAGCVPVTVNLRKNASVHPARNSRVGEWRRFFDECAAKYPVRFIITCDASEIDPGLRACRNVVYAKDHHTELLDDLTLIREAAFHLGAASGPSAVAIFGSKPYYVFNCDAAPHLALYQGALRRCQDGDLRLSFASDLQGFGISPETTQSIQDQFERIWSSREWTPLPVLQAVRGRAI